MTACYATLTFIFGLLIGSFLNVCIYRIPLGQSVMTIPSHCCSCGKKIKWYDLMPLISYIILRGKCRFCKERISIRYPLVEILNAVIYILIYQTFGLSIQMAGFAILASALVVIAFIDYDLKIIPDIIIVFLIVVGIIYSILARDITHFDRIIGFFSASLPLYIIMIVSKGGMGGGDIKLMAAAGIYLGWKLTLLALFLGSVIGSVAAVILLLLKRKTRRDEIPFGPALAAGIILSALYGNQMLSWYLGILMYRDIPLH